MIKIKIIITMIICIIILSCLSGSNKENQIYKIKIDYSDKNNWLQIPVSSEKEKTEILTYINM